MREADRERSEALTGNPAVLSNKSIERTVQDWGVRRFWLLRVVPQADDRLGPCGAIVRIGSRVAPEYLAGGGDFRWKGTIDANEALSNEAVDLMSQRVRLFDCLRVSRIVRTCRHLLRISCLEA